MLMKIPDHIPIRIELYFMAKKDNENTALIDFGAKLLKFQLVLEGGNHVGIFNHFGSLSRYANISCKKCMHGHFHYLLFQQKPSQGKSRAGHRKNNSNA